MVETRVRAWTPQDAAVAAEGELRPLREAESGSKRPMLSRVSSSCLRSPACSLTTAANSVMAARIALAGGGGRAPAFEGLEGELDAGLAREVGEGGEGLRRR